MPEKPRTRPLRRVPWDVFTLSMVWLPASLLTAAEVTIPDIRRPTPEEFTQSLQLSEGLEATLFISEPDINSPTNIDIDDRGRLWVCDVLNYRAHLGRRPAGDRILILEDTTGDGRCDTTTVFYQGPDIDSALGICVLGNQIIVSCSPHAWVFTDVDGDDQPDSKKVLFRTPGRSQHDHALHAFVIGPGGRLYFNHGNTTTGIANANDEILTDTTGRRLVNDGNPFRQGLAYRCNLDGSNLTVMGHNFRNPYELAVDSFGTVWQSDNDDDGNQGVRLNQVLEHGNFGFRDEVTGATWTVPRVGAASDRRRRHWHQNDPGVVPNLLVTGNGSPTGITVYEGRLLPESIHDRLLHCDAGPGVCRAYTLIAEEGQPKLSSQDIVRGPDDHWFRPADVAVAPDGSLFVADWHDPTVGGHRAGDVESGRIYRIAPRGTGYHIPSHDFATIQGASRALTSPNQAVRYKAWQVLVDRANAAEPALEALATDENPRIRARALWALAQRQNQSLRAIELARSDRDANLRVVAIRIARQHKARVLETIESLLDDPAWAVRCECAIALRDVASAEGDQLWARLAASYKEGDRWLLEALGIAAEGRWNERLGAWYRLVAVDESNRAHHDIIWRSRADQTPKDLARLLTSIRSPDDSPLRYLRALQLQPEGRGDAEISGLAARLDEFEPSVAIEIAQRIEPATVHGDAALRRQIVELVGTLQSPEQVALFVHRFGFEQPRDRLIAFLRQADSPSEAYPLVQALASIDSISAVARFMTDEQPVPKQPVAMALAELGSPKTLQLLEDVLLDSSQPEDLRLTCTRALGSHKHGRLMLLKLVHEDQLPRPLRMVTGEALHAAQTPEIRAEAVRLFPLPETTSQDPFPQLDELLARQGSAERGKALFFDKSKCATCHRVGDRGTEVGPGLDDIGGKLSRQSLYVSILDPSAAINHNYQSHVLELGNGLVETGLLVNQTDQNVAIKTAQGILKSFTRAEVEAIEPSPVSLMPANLQQLLTTDELIDVVAYLTTLKSAQPAAEPSRLETERPDNGP